VLISYPDKQEVHLIMTFLPARSDSGIITNPLNPTFSLVCGEAAKREKKRNKKTKKLK